MMFLDCPAWLDHKGAVRCGLPAEVRCRFTMRSTDGPVESAMIRCPAGHYFCGAIESLTRDGKDKHYPDHAGPGSRAGRGSLQRGHGGRHGGGGLALRDVPAELERTGRRPNTAPAYYLGHPAGLWITVMRPRRRRTASRHAMQITAGGGKQNPLRQGSLLVGARAETACTTPAATSWPVTRVQ
jgi:hypothetical protein